jgi:putative alpha-1,2-mannosidase
MKLLHLLAMPLALAATQALAKPAPPPVDLVDLFMGAAGDRGQLSPAAAAPFGMVQLAPDTDPANHAGYDQLAPMLKGFSQTRAQGVGCGGGGGDLMTSVTYAGETGFAPIDHASERAGPGWYRVRYGKTPIVAELAAGQSVSISRFEMTRAGIAEIALDPTHSYARHTGDLRVQLDNATVCNKGVYHLAIAARLTLNGRSIGTPATVDGAGVLRVSIRARAGDKVELRLALSTVDTESAKTVLDRELGSLTLAELISRTRAQWNAVLSRIVFDGPLDRRKLFYTCLFRALQMPARIDDFNGALRGSDGQLRYAPRGHHRYSGWSLWDNYRTQAPLVALVAPDVAGDIADSLVLLFQSNKPQWATASEPFLTVRTEHAGIALLDLHRKKLGSLDPATVLTAMAAETERSPQALPGDRLELAYDQWAVAELASDTGRADLARDFRGRALAYRPMWLSVFRDLGADSDVINARGLYQGTLWQYRWAPVFDLAWLQGEALGPARFADELSEFFDRELFNMTNEPDIQAPFLFALTDTPGRTDVEVARLRDQPINQWYDNERKYAKPIMQKSFSLSPGFAEGMDDDGGAMSAWYVWSSIGLYPLVPGDPFYIVSEPAASRILVRLPANKTLSITRVECSIGEGIASVRLNGIDLGGRRIEHADLINGGSLTFCRR